MATPDDRAVQRGNSTPAVWVSNAVNTQIAVGDGNVQIQLTHAGVSSYQQGPGAPSAAIVPRGHDYLVSPNASAALARAGAEPVDARTTADGLFIYLSVYGERAYIDPGLLLAVTRQLNAQGHHTRAARLARAGASIALAAADAERASRP